MPESLRNLRKASLSLEHPVEPSPPESNSDTLPTDGSITTSRIFSRPETLPITMNTTTSSYASHARKVVDEQFQFINNADESDDTIDEYDLETVDEPQRQDVTLERFITDGDRTIEVDETGLCNTHTHTHTHTHIQVQ